MKNHWLKVHRKKNNGFWTAEFIENGLFVLNPRKIELLNAKSSFTSIGLGVGKVGIIFKNAALGTSDMELFNFLGIAKHRMHYWEAKIRNYKGFAQEQEFFELKNLVFDSVSMGIYVDDIKVVFEYHSIRHFNCP
jgi:hypothetical protein